MEPTIITYTGDGKTKTFGFGFSFFQPNDIIVETNGAPTTAQYALQTAKPNPTADMPYTGGAVFFADAPAAGVEIKIYREFVMTRPGDFQPTAEIEAHQLNREFNFNLENMRDFRDRQHATNATVKEHDDKIAQIIECLSPSGGDISTTPGDTNTPDTPNVPSVDLAKIKNQIANLESNIATLTTQLETRAPQSDVTQIQSSITALNTRCENLSNRIENIDIPTLPDDMDYVIESQMPSASNNYTWYRKYKSGWVEQGGITGSTSSLPKLAVINLPLEMQDQNYCVNVSIFAPNESSSVDRTVRVIDRQTQTFTAVRTANGNASQADFFWMVCGYC